MNKAPSEEPSYGAPPFGRASAHLSGGVFLFVVCFIAAFEKLARKFALDEADLQTGILFPTFVGALIGFTATWSKDLDQKSLGGLFGVLNALLLIAYGLFFLLFKYGTK